MRVGWLVLAALSCSAPSKQPPSLPPIAPPAPVDTPLVLAPLPRAPEGRLPRTFEPTRYAARLHVDPAIVMFSGTIEISGQLAEASSVIWLNAENLAVHRVSASRDGVVVRLAAAMPKGGLLALQSEQPLAAGTWTLSIAYSGMWNMDEAAGGFRQPFNAEHYVFTQFEPDYARRVFPCVDEPDRKVPWQLTIDAPDALVVASNTPIESEERHGPFTTKTVRFKPTLPLPSYLVAFAVGPFDVVDAGAAKSGVPIRILTLHGQQSFADHATSATATLLDNVETKLGVPFAYPKLDLVAVPRTAPWWAAMENAGLVTFRADMLRSADEWDGVITHEIVHHWFGNLVTPAWWDDIWLSESFAYWLGNKRERLERRYYEGSGAVLGSVESPRMHLGSSGQHAMYAHLAINRGVAVLRQLETYLGADRFTAALRAYLTKHAHGNARTADLLRALGDTAADPALVAAAERYLTDAGLATVSFELRCDKRARRVELAAIEKPALVCVAYDHDGKRRDRCVTVVPAAPAIELGTKRCPRWVMPTSLQPIGWQPKQLEALRDHGWPALQADEQLELAHQAVRGDSKQAALRWSYIAKLASSTDVAVLTWLSFYLVELDHLVPPALRGRYDAWLLKVLGPRARAVGLSPRDNDDQTAKHLRASSWLLSLVGLAGDKTLQTEALALLPRLHELTDPMVRATVLQLAVRARPSLADELVAEPPTTAQDREQEIELALSAVPDPLAFATRHRDAIAAKSPWFFESLLARVCDETKRAEVAELAKQRSKVSLRDFDWCITQRALLEPELRAFLNKR